MSENDTIQTIPAVTPDKLELFLEAIKNATFFDDWYMRFFMKDNIPCAQLLIRICLNKPDLVIVKMHVEEELPEQSPMERGARLDIWARDDQNAVYNIEVQSDSRGSSPKRAFHYLARMAIEEMPKGMEPEKRPSLYVIFITRWDVLGEGKDVYWLCGKMPDGKDSGIDANIVYINGSWKADDKIGHLMKDLKNPDSKSMHYKLLADRTQFLKQRDEVKKMTDFWQKVMDKGMEIGMNKGMEKGMEKGMDIGRDQMIQTMLARGASNELICQYTGISMDVIAELKNRQDKEQK